MVSYYSLATMFASGIFIWQIIKRFFPWFSEDLASIKKFANSLRVLSKFKTNAYCVCDKLFDNAKSSPHQRFLLYEDEQFTYQEVDEWSNRCARAFRSLGIVAGDKVGVLMMNEPAFIALWFGSNKTGATASFLNTNLRQKSLLHCIDLSDIKVLVFGKDDVLLEAVKEIDEELKQRNIKTLIYGPAAGGYDSFEAIADEQPFEDCPFAWRKDVVFTDPICYIFTSGTTGLPKAVNVNNYKCWAGSQVLNFLSPTPSDVVYTAMPLYHSAASLIGIGGAIYAGCTVALRRKFSATQFLPDCRKYGVTIAQYVGETLRYVCNQPEIGGERDHSMRAVIGNGLRPDVWKKFLDRFGSHIHVFEFYAATEGNIGFFNFHNHPGCIGSYGPILSKIGSAAFVKYDHDSEEMIRDKNGRGIQAGFDEPALLIGKITPRYQISTYKGKESLTQKKILRDVFKDGDEYFNTGDLMKIDSQYKVYFCDRLGDTFRWKGENVSTNEVGDTIAQAPGVKEVNVYGVQIPGQDGRAGMAAIVPESESLDYRALYEHVCNTLPSYARPLFLRIQKELEITGTMKQRKVNLKKEGYNLEAVSDDQLYFIDNKQKTYVQLTRELQNSIESGEVRV